jgi:hypothetical protein
MYRTKYVLQQAFWTQKMPTIEFMPRFLGGAELGVSGLSFSNGAQTISFVRSWLGTRHVSITAESLGGKERREIILVPDKGGVYCRKLILDDAFLSQERVLLSSSNNETGGKKVELF